MKITADIINSHGLKPQEYKKIINLIGKEPNLLELGIFSAMWNEHCSYKSSKKYLKNLPTKNEKVIQGPGENAGVVDIEDNDALVLLCEVENPERFGIADVKDNKIVKIMEKPKEPPTNFAVTGIYFLTPKIFDVFARLKPSWRNELEITDALQILLEEKNKIEFEMITDYWKDTGTPQDIIHANMVILKKMTPYFKGKKADDVIIRGNVMVGDETIIGSGVEIEGPAIIGNNCLIDANSRIGPNTSIGNNSKIRKCNIENSIIMSNCEINLDVNIKDSIIALNSDIRTNQENKTEKIFLLGEGTRISL